MKQIVIVKPTKGYAHWKNAIEGETHIKAKTKITGFKNPMVSESELHNWPEIPNLANSNSINN